MSLIVAGTKAVPVGADRIIIVDSEEVDPVQALKEISFDNLRVSAVEITDTVGGEHSRWQYRECAARAC